MDRHGERLVGRNALDGLLFAAGADKRAAAHAIATQCGYDVNHPHPFYPVEVGICLAQRLGELLYPAMSKSEAQRELGFACSVGYASTITGMMSLSKSRSLTLGDALRYGMEVSKHEIPFINYQLEQLGERHYRVTLNNWPLHPSFMVGALLNNLTVNGATQPTCEVEVKDEHHYVYELTWA